MRKPTALVLSLILCLGLTACAPTAETTPTPPPTETVTPTAMPTADVTSSTPTPTPTPTVEPTPAHRWSGHGYTYISETLGIRVEFPPEWDTYFSFVEEQKENFYTNSDGPADVITLMPAFEIDEIMMERDPVFGRIYWLPKGVEGPEYMSKIAGALVDVTLWKSDEGRYVCLMDTMLQMDFDPVPGTGEVYPAFGEIRVMFQSVQNGIMDGRWEIEVLEK